MLTSAAFLSPSLLRVPEHDPLWARGNPSGFAAGKIDTWMLSNRAVTRDSCKSWSKVPFSIPVHQYLLLYPNNLSPLKCLNVVNNSYFSIGVKEVGGEVGEKLPPSGPVPCQSAEQVINVRMLIMVTIVEEGLLACKDELEV